MLELEYTYTEEPDGWLVGYLNAYPDDWTQGKDVAELELMLADIYAIMQEKPAILAELAEIEQRKKARQHTGILRIGAELLS